MAQSIKFDNNIYMDSTGVAHNNEPLSDYLNTGIINSAIGINRGGDYTIPAPGGAYTNYQQYPFEQTYAIRGNAFSRNGATIVANKTCMALVMFTLNIDGNSENVQLKLQKNSNDIFTGDAALSNMNNTHPFCFLVSLSKGDVLSLYVGFSQNTTHLSRGQRSYFNAIELL